jgi:endoglucanase
MILTVNTYKKISLLTCLISYFLAFTTFGQSAGSQAGNRVNIISITPSINTGQDYSPWLNDDLNDLVQNQWSSNNLQYIDVTLTLAKRVKITQISLYDYQGEFPNTPASIYALNGNKRTLLGVFTGESYLQWVNINPINSITADAIIIHKYGNNIPVKLKIFGLLVGATSTPTPVQTTIDFPAIATKLTGAPVFDLVATSNNTTTPLTFTSSNPGVIAVSNASGKWQATVGSAGTANITASQAGSATYLAATNVVQPVVVTAPVQKPVATSGVGKIPIAASRWYQLTNSPDGIAALFDGVTSENVVNGWGRVIGTFDAYYPLQPGETFSIESIKFFDGWGSNANNPMTLSIITDTWQRIPIASFLGTNDQQWVGPYPNRPTTFTLDNPVRNARYLVLTSSWAYPTEVELYGSYTLPAPPSFPVLSPSDLASQKQIKLKQSMGVNAFEWNLEANNNPSVVDPSLLAAVKNFTGIRHYLDWEKIESVEGSYTFNPSHMGSWNYDAMYERLKQEGIEVLACVKTVPSWMLASYPSSVRDAENVPVRYGKDFAQPTSYIEQAKMAFQFAARYGNNPNVDRSLVRVDTSPPRWTNDPVNQVKIGLNLIKYIECDNERDKWWKGRAGYQTALEYAANLSAFYDGNMNTMGPGVGVKNADPTMQVVMGGLASPNPDYVKGMVEWCRQYRGYKADGSVNLCWDVINYHHYSNDAGTSQGGNPTRGAAPEVSDAGRAAKAFIVMAHEYAHDMPVWITEAGFDLNQGSVLKAIAVGSRTVQETQADWILRTALAYTRWGVERVFSYQLYDDNPNSTTQFSSMGLVNSDMTPRLAAQYLRQTNQLLGTYSYQQTLNADPIVDRYQLNGQSAYMLVVPDEHGRTASYTLNLGTAAYADVYRPTSGSAMTVQRIMLQGGQLTLQVSETPLFVLPAGSIPSQLTVSATPMSATTIAAATASATNNLKGTAQTAETVSTGEAVELTAYPNPFTEESLVQFRTVTAGNVTLVVYDLQGRVVRTLFSGAVKAAELQQVSLRAEELPAGVYTIQLTTGAEVVHKRVVLNK